MTQDSPRGGACVGRRRKNKICGKMGEDEGTAAVLATPASPTTAQPSHTSHPAHPPTLPPHSSHPAQILTLTPHTSAPVTQPHATPVPQLPLQSDDNITPTPNYRNMATPTLKVSPSTGTHAHTHLTTPPPTLLPAGGVLQVWRQSTAQEEDDQETGGDIRLHTPSCW